MKNLYVDEWNCIENVRKAKYRLENLSGEINEPRKAEERYVYQYRSLDSFWAIVQSDSFWATNARFSNDLEEQNLGRKKINLLLPEDSVKERENFGDCYIVCFCDDNDKLSQWRGYAEEGVAIGFDFINIRPFYIELNSGQNEKKTYRKYYNSCYKVVYIDDNTSALEFAECFDLDISEDENNVNFIRKWAGEIIPYIKHNGFYEEAESRLVFSGSDMDLSDCVRYRDISKMKVPYIVVKMGDDESKKEKQRVVRINIAGQKGAEIKQFLESELGEKAKVIACGENTEEPLDYECCYGCTIREAYKNNLGSYRIKCRCSTDRKHSFYIETGNEIYLSDCQGQEEFFYEIHTLLKKNKAFADVKIWCDGHLPIRNITVGSMRGKEEVAESIRHYCNNHYWLKSVDVIYSKTPYRSKLL